MDLTPGERAILRQLRQLYAGSSNRAHPMTAVTSQWPAVHYEAYRSSFSGLIGKRLVQPEANGQMVRLTAAGFEALGLSVPPAASAITPAAAKAVSQAQPPAAKPAKTGWRFWRT
jgi:hypothetical protein